jgi:hypothetical protein
MSQFDMFAESGTEYESLGALFAAMMKMTDDRSVGRRRNKRGHQSWQSPG